VKIIASDLFAEKSFLALVYTGVSPQKINISDSIRGLRKESAVRRRAPLASVVNETYSKLGLDILIFIVPILQDIISKECPGNRAELERFRSLVSEFERTANEFKDSQEYQWLYKTRDRGIYLLEESETMSFDGAANEVLDMFQRICEMFFKCKEAARPERPAPRKPEMTRRVDVESDALRAEVERLRDQLVKKDQEISELLPMQKKFMDASERVRELERLNMDLDSSCRALKRELDDTRARLEREKQRSANVTSYVDSLRSTIRQQNVMLDESKKRNDVLQEAVQECQKNLKLLQAPA